MTSQIPRKKIPPTNLSTFYSRKMDMFLVFLSGLITRNCSGTENFDNNIKKQNSSKGLSNDISGSEIHHSYQKKLPKRTKNSFIDNSITDL